MTIITRAQWGAVYGDGRPGATCPADEVWLHHSATQAPDVVAPFDDDYAAVRRLEAIGAARFGSVYGLSYTFVVTPAGLIFEGHNLSKLGAHTQGHNTIGRAICLVGNYSERDLTPAQMDAVVWLLRHGEAAGWWTRAALSGGHRDTKQTECPGNRAYAAIGEINRRARERVAPTTSAPSPVKLELPTLRYGDTGSAVKNLQSFLRRVFSAYAGSLGVDGSFGPQTKGAVEEFQRRVRLTADGVVGPRTNAELARYGYRA